MSEDFSQFEKRKREHIQISLDPRSQVIGASGLDDVHLIHEALPDLNFDEIQLETQFSGHRLRNPIIISSMTAGHEQGVHLNRVLVQLAHEYGMLMGVGSQRRELLDRHAQKEWGLLRQEYPEAMLLGNVGISQVITHHPHQIYELIENLGAIGLFVHLNPLQECLQPEGTPQFRGGYKALEELVSNCPVPVIVKETGSGFSKETLLRLSQLPLAAVDVSGLGGTHWGRIEGFRSAEDSVLFQVGRTFAEWGESTLSSIRNGVVYSGNIPIWASGGLRSGVDVVKVLAMGAQMAGIAQPFLAAALRPGDVNDNLRNLVNRLEYEMKVALFCTGTSGVHSLPQKRIWEWRRS